MPQFKPGQSGNPKGRAPGIRDRRHDMRDALRDRAPDLVARCIDLALDGDMQAMRLCLERALPALRPTAAPVTFDPGATPTDTARNLLAAAAAGTLPPDTAAALVGAVGVLARVTELDELERRLAALEARQDGADANDETYL